MEQITRRPPLPPELCTAIRHARQARGRTLVEAARDAGISASHLKNVEAGRRAPSVAVAADIARALELDVDTTQQLRAAAAPDRGKSAPRALEAGRWHEGQPMTWPPPTVTTWLRQQSSATPEQLMTFIGTVDRRRLARLDAEMRAIGQALRAFVWSDNALIRAEVAEAISRALERLERQR